jgi:hypothetical protein
MDAPLDRIEQILTLLGPGLFLQMDHAAFPAFFGGDIRRETAEVQAQHFAKSHGCKFFREGQVATFGMAYSESDNDE